MYDMNQAKIIDNKEMRQNCSIQIRNLETVSSDDYMQYECYKTLSLEIILYYSDNEYRADGLHIYPQLICYIV